MYVGVRFPSICFPHTRNNINRNRLILQWIWTLKISNYTYKYIRGIYIIKHFRMIYILLEFIWLQYVWSGVTQSSLSIQASHSSSISILYTVNRNILNKNVRNISLDIHYRINTRRVSFERRFFLLYKFSNGEWRRTKNFFCLHNILLKALSSCVHSLQRNGKYSC